MLAKRVSEISPSPTLAMTAKVRELRASGVDVISFAAGEPDFDTPAEICDAAVSAIRGGQTRYTAGAGTPELRAAVADKLVRENAIEAAAEQIVVTNGAKQAVYNALMAICDPGDEVIVISPHWMTYADQITLASGKPVFVRTNAELGCIPDPKSIELAVTPRTKAIIVNSPCNPTGAVFPRAIIEAIAALAESANIYIISDEIYEHHVYDGVEHVSFAALSPAIAARTVTINGVSKAYAMTGWRLGYSCSTTALAKAMATIQDQVTSNAGSISQAAAIKALTMPQAIVREMAAEFGRRRETMVEGLCRIPGVRCATPKGAFYAFPDFSHVIAGRFGDDVQLADFFLGTCHVACVPGSYFGGNGHLRLSYCMSREDIDRGLNAIAEGVRSLK